MHACQCSAHVEKAEPDDDQGLHVSATPVLQLSGYRLHRRHRWMHGC